MRMQGLKQGFLRLSKCAKVKRLESFRKRPIFKIGLFVEKYLKIVYNKPKRQSCRNFTIEKKGKNKSMKTIDMTAFAGGGQLSCSTLTLKSDEARELTGYESEHYSGKNLVESLSTVAEPHHPDTKMQNYPGHPEFISGSQTTNEKETEILNSNNLCCMKQSTFQNDNAKAAFTLAEVLITLGIIGIVAAMTMPALIANYKKKETATRLKKFNTVMTQAIMLSEVENGDSKYWEKSNDYLLKDENGDLIRDENGNEQYDDNKGIEFTYPFIMRYFAPYIKYSKIEKALPYSNGRKYTTIFFADGSVVRIKLGMCVDWTYFVNGIKASNSGGRDTFYFLFCPWHPQSYAKWGPYYNLAWKKGRDDIISKCKSDALACSKLLEFDGWEFNDDYPYKL